MNDKYNIQLEKLREEYMLESEKALKETENLYNKMLEQEGHAQFLSQSINKPIIKFSKKYRVKIQQLNEKYKK